MHTTMRNSFKFAAVLLLVLALLGSGLSQLRVQAAALPPTPCTGTGTVTCNLFALAGAVTMPDSTPVTLWGYASTAAGPAGSPGPVLIVNQNDVVTVNFTNNLPEASALLFQGQAMIPDLTGAAANGGTRTYTFTASQPGTFLYEAGLLPNAAHQVAMGLYGVLVVRPTGAPTQAYPAAATAFDDEALVVLGDVDPALNNSANPAAVDMRDYAPRYFLINGKAYPQTDPIAVLAGHRVLLRYVNAGQTPYSMTVLGLPQVMLATDGSPFSNPRSVTAESLAPGQSADMLVTVPAAAVDGTRFAVYDANLMLHNNKASNSLAGSVGGMLAFILVGTPPPPGADVTGPAAAGLTLSPNPTDGSVSVTLNATISDVATGGANIQAAQFTVDSTGGTPTAMVAVDAAFDSPTEAVQGTIAAGLPAGGHTVYVRGQDALGNWGPYNPILLNVDGSGPVVSALGLTPNPGNGSADVVLSATADDRANGGSNIIAAEYSLDGGSAVAMTVNAAAPVASLTATLPAATINALSEGPHSVAVRAQDALNNWGTAVTISLVVDKTGPAASNVLANPAATNGSTGFNSSTAAVRVTAALADSAANITAAEGFIDTVGANGTGFIVIATDGQFNSLTENAYGDIPLGTINALSLGTHTLYVHGKDAAGNWGPAGSTGLLIDKAAPTFSGISVAPSPTFGAANATLTVNGAADTGGSGVAGGEYWLNPPTTTTPAPGSGTPFSGSSAVIPVGSLATGNYTVSARIRDAAGNWSTTTRSTTLRVVPDVIFSNGFETGFTGWSRSTTNTTRMNVTAGAALVGNLGLQAQGNNTNYVQYNFGTTANPASTTYDARFYFRPNANNSSGKDILVAASGTGFSNAQTVFRVRYRLNGGTPQIQIQLGISTANTTWTALTGGATNNVIEVVWQAVGSGGPNPGSLRLYVNGTLAQTLTTTSNAAVTAVRLGSVTNTGNSTLMYFDAFASKRQVSPLLGP